MQYRIDKKSGNKLSILGFGCMRFPTVRGSIDMAAAESLIMNAYRAGVNYFDTAYIYPGSEVALGKVLAKNQIRREVYIATKLPLVFLKGPADFDKYFNRHLERLQTDYIDYYLLHMLTDMALWKKLCAWGIREWLAEKKAAGKIRQIGFSFHGIRDEFIEIIDDYPWDFTQIQYNYANENYQAGVKGLKHAAGKDIPVIIMEPLLGGKLVTGLPKEATRLLHAANPALTNAGWALRWLWNQPEVTCVLSGMNADVQLRDNLSTADTAEAGMLTDDELRVYQAVQKEFNKTYRIPCTGCSYCMPCPKNVNIPACFSAYNNYFALGKRSGNHQYWMSTGIVSDVRSCASLCVKCGKCETHCPQNIPIRKELENVVRVMEPGWFRFGLNIVRTVLGKNKRTNQKK